MANFAILVPILWLVAIVLLIVLEAVTYQLVAIWFALGAAAALIASLLDASGNLAEPGWARSLLPVYCRSQIRAPKTRIKEWDYYCITDGHIGLALTIADNGYMGLDSISFLNFDECWEITKSPMRLFPMGKTHLPESSRLGASEIAASGCHFIWTTSAEKMRSRASSR